MQLTGLKGDEESGGPLESISSYGMGPVLAAALYFPVVWYLHDRMQMPLLNFSNVDRLEAEEEGVGPLTSIASGSGGLGPALSAALAPGADALAGAPVGPAEVFIDGFAVPEARPPCLFETPPVPLIRSVRPPCLP